ncbi:MAG: acetyl-CoA carboxylase biotin carboxyl carrier protein [Alphaproteobacteria bacterium]|nr:acetyl-CoA carboxylase biotin carboxyl carrier protein [Alphaproteobacteria bacterium]
MAKFDVDPALVRKLGKLLDDTGLTEIEYSEEGRTIRVARTPAAVAPPPATAAPVVDIEVRTEPAGPNPDAVTAPMVGVVYLSPDPGAPAFVKVGDAVNEGQTLLLIEAMKTFNPVRAPRAGRIARILVADKTPVEFGEELVILE